MLYRSPLQHKAVQKLSVIHSVSNRNSGVDDDDNGLAMELMQQRMHSEA